MITFCGEYKDILRTIHEAGNREWNNTHSEEVKVTMLECATKIYIEQMRLIAAANPECFRKTGTPGIVKTGSVTDLGKVYFDEETGTIKRKD